MKLSRRVRLKSMKIKYKNQRLFCWDCLSCIFCRKKIVKTPPVCTCTRACNPYPGMPHVHIHRHSTYGCNF